MKNVLIVDDDASFIEMMKVSLDPSRYAVASAVDGQDALHKRQEFTPDIILLDINMPRMDGLEFLKKLNERYGEGKTPIIITSNLSTLDKISEGMELGIRGYIIKSNESLKSILSTIEGILA